MMTNCPKLFFLSLCIPVMTAAKAPVTKGDSAAAAVAFCQTRAAMDFVIEAGIACLNGPVEDILKFSQAIPAGYPKTAVISSEGGALRDAMTLARWLHQTQAAIVIDGPCLSACANYLVPVARHITITPRSVIAMHGSVPRGIQSFSMSRQVRGAEPDRPEIARRIKEFPALRAGLLAEETALFDLILVDDAYLTRYSELVRTATTRDRLQTAPSRRVTLILDDLYLEAFGIRPHYLGGKPDQAAQIANLGCRAARDFLLFGFYGELVRRPGEAPAECRRAADNPQLF